jgi:hypothetical protein
MDRSNLVGCGMAMLVACGGSSSTLPRGAAPMDAGQTEAAAMSEDDAQTQMEASVTTDATEDGGTAGPDDRIDPIEVGRIWTYDIQQLGTYPLCPGGVHSGTALGAMLVDGKQAIQVQSACANAGSAYYAVAGDVVQIDEQGTWRLALDAPVQEGHTWSDGTSTFTWHSVGSVTVPAGTFEDCWSATENVAYPAYAIFCRGVGPVRWYTKDAQGNGYDAQLHAKNF